MSATAEDVLEIIKGAGVRECEGVYYPDADAIIAALAAAGLEIRPLAPAERGRIEAAYQNRLSRFEE